MERVEFQIYLLVVNVKRLQQEVAKHSKYYQQDPIMVRNLQFCIKMVLNVLAPLMDLLGYKEVNLSQDTKIWMNVQQKRLQMIIVKETWSFLVPRVVSLVIAAIVHRKQT